jgi:hypothetical protein
MKKALLQRLEHLEAQAKRAKPNFLRRTFRRSPLLDPPLQGPQLPVAELAWSPAGSRRRNLRGGAFHRVGLARAQPIAFNSFSM